MKLYGGRKTFGANLYETEVPRTYWLTERVKYVVVAIG